jgi:hypothetical protein
MTELFKNYKNISFLDNSYEDYNSIRFIGTTLWSNITNPTYKINDTNMIKEMDVEKYNFLHKESLIFLESAISNEKKNIIITHQY